jgi:hypothetical protein
MNVRTVMGSALSAALLAGCAGAPSRMAEPVALASPAAPGSGEPRLAVTPGGRVLMTWFEAGAGETQALRFAALEGDAWSAPVTIAAGDSFFVNWADFPALLALGEREMAVSYPWMNGAGTYAYDVVLRRSADGGATWGPPLRPHSDGTATEHGFVTLLPAGRDVRAVWLDGRNFAGHGGHDDHDAGPGPDMTLRSAIVGADGALREETVLDTRTCDCCATGGGVAGGGALIAYRDRSETEVRDISIVRLAEGEWSAPAPLHDDGWEIAGCPVNGPAVAAAGARVAIAWYTQEGDSGIVRVAFSNDGGASFGAPFALDGGQPLGRTGIALLPDGAAVVSWIEAAGEEAEIRLRRVDTKGTMQAPIVLATTSPRRASGVPQLVLAGGRLVCAWTEPGEAPRIRVAAVPLER